MDFEQVKFFFSDISINKYVLENQFTSQKVKQEPGSFSLFKIIVSKAGDYTFSVA